MIKELVKKQAVLYGDELFATDIDSLETLTYCELEKKACEYADLLKNRGVGEGQAVGLFMENCLEFMLCFYGILFLNAIPVPMNPAIENKKLRYIIDDANLHYIIKKEADISAISDISVCEHSVIQEVTMLELNHGDMHHKKVECVEDTALILYTSGTTGEPKGVQLTHKNLISEMRYITEAHRLERKDKVLCVLPWYHINGLVITMLTPLLAGHKLFVTSGFDAEKFWKQVKTYQITWFSGVPVFYSYLLLEQEETVGETTLRFARSASSPLSVSVIKKFEEKYKIPVIESYGMTEGGSQLTSNPLPPQQRKAGSVGLAFGNKIKIVDEQWNDMPIMEEGEVAVRGDNITAGYLNKPSVNQETFHDKWMKTGDIGYLDEDGYLFLTGRKKELINRMGEKFSPKEIDEVIYEIDGVEIAGTVGITHQLYGEQVVSFIKLREGTKLSVAEIKKYCRNKLMDIKVPKEIIFLDQFPLGDNGKVQRKKLVELYKEKYDEE